uniref:Putative salivary lipocalin n=1 Tax=Ixodes ricinus TaxID=34613 RepID=A0A0K8R8I8_IXORI
MLAFLCVVAALLAPSNTELTKEEREERQGKSTKNAWLLLTDKRTHYLLYRSVENDTAYGGFKPCVNMSLKRCWDGSKELWYNFYYQGIPTNDLYPEATMWIKMKEYSQEKNLMSIEYDYYYGGSKDYTLLFTDYQTCFTLLRDHDKVLQVWMIGSTNTTRINDTCHSTYNETLNNTGHHSEIPRYYIYNDTICGTK